MRAHPQEFVDRVELLCRSHQDQVVAELLDLCPSVISLMRKRGWKAATSGAPKRPVPEDFAWLNHKMSFSELTEHYRCGNTTLSRWFRETPSARPMDRGRALRKDPATGKRMYELMSEGAA